MSYYADTNSDGTIKAFYADDVHTSAQIPSTAVKITDAQWQEWIANTSTRAWDATTSTLKTIALPAPTTAQLWAPIRDQRTALINNVRWLVDRHRDQTDAGHATTLTATQYQSVLAYIQALRDVPETESNPASITWPTAPTF